MAPEFTEGGIVGQGGFINGHSFFNSFHIGGRVKMLFEINQIVVIRECYIENFSTLIHRSSAKLCDIDKKW